MRTCSRTRDRVRRLDSNPTGVYSEQKLYTVLALIFSAIFFDIDIDIAKLFPLCQADAPAYPLAVARAEAHHQNVVADFVSVDQR